MTPGPQQPGTQPSAQPSAAPVGLWGRLVGGFLDNRLVVVLLALILIGAGIYVAPLGSGGGSGESGDSFFPRDPIAVDALPDTGDNQQIVFTEWPGRSPRDVDDQITYPLTTALLGIPGVRTIRSTSALGFSAIYVIFGDGVEFYWSRSRVLEKLASLAPGTVPEGVTPTLGPDATALGQIFWYTLEGRDPEGRTVGGFDPDELRSIQDWTVRYALQAVEGVSEVAGIGGFLREYQVDVDPEALRAHGVSLAEVADAVRSSNLDVGARTLEINGVEYLIRGLGLLRSLDDLEATVVVAREQTPLRIRDLARVHLGPALRRGALDDAGGPAVGGVVVARYGANPQAVIAAVKTKLAAIQPGLPRRILDDGTPSQVTIVPFYDRSELIDDTLGTLSAALYQQLLITVLVVVLLLRDLRSSLLVAGLLPLGVLGALVTMKIAGVDANIMALGGIAIAIGAMVDIAIVFVENIDQHLEEGEKEGKKEKKGKEGEEYHQGGPRQRIQRAIAEVAPAVLTSTLTTIVSFLPVFGLSSADLRLFAPLALTKTFAMVAAFVITLALLPGVALLFLGRSKASPRPVGGGLPGALRQLLRGAHLRDWCLLVLGIVLLGGGFPGEGSGLVGGLALAYALARLAAPLVGLAGPGALRRWRWGLRGLAGGATVVIVAALLVDAWLPLGPGPGWATNALFVGLLIVGILGSLWLFEWAYPALLRGIVRTRASLVLFLMVPLGLVIAGGTAWIGADRLVGAVAPGLRGHPAVRAAADIFPGLGREYMPALDEGAFLYMPTTMPHASIGEVLGMLSAIDAAIAGIPEVDHVVGKAGRVDSALDPAPLAMIETLITYKPEYRITADGRRERQWRPEIQSPRDIWDAIVRAADHPGLTGAPLLMPISTRLVMLQSGMRAPMGIKVQGPSLEVIEAFGRDLEDLLREVPELRRQTIFAERVVGKPYLEIDLDREAIGRYGLSIARVQELLQVALGGIALTRTIEGRERYPVRVRYMREERDSLESLARIAVPTTSGDAIPLGQLAEIRYVRGPQMIRSEDTFLTSYVLFDRDPEVTEIVAVEAAQARVAEAIARGELTVPEGVSYAFAGAYENQLRSEARLRLLVPLAIVLVFILLYLQFRRVIVALIIASGVMVAVAGGFLMLWLYGQPGFLDFEVFGAAMDQLFRVGPVRMSMAVWVGVIALVGIATDDGVVMSTYLRQHLLESPPTTLGELRDRVVAAGCRRVRPCLMTTATTLLALLPVITSQGRGADVMAPMALPLVGGMAVALVTLFVVPVLTFIVEARGLRRGAG